MRRAKYLIVGSSHAGLEAAAAIRMSDADGGLAMLTRDGRMPYSPTILPYVVSRRSQPERVVLRDADWFAGSNVELVRGARVVAVAPALHRVTLDSGEEWEYERLLLATGARPAVPPIAGLDGVRYHVLRTMDDAVGLRDAIARGGKAVVLGAGLIGLHAAENLAKAGLAVTVVEMQAQVLAGYFDSTAAGIIAGAFAANGVRLLLGRRAVTAAPSGDGCRVVLDDGAELDADLLVVATGVVAETGFLDGSGIETDRGILVDDTMRTGAADVWAAGDVAQARSFLGDGRSVNAILPSAVEQGRIAGMDMAGDAAVKPFPGGVPLNTYTFFGHHAVAVGAAGEGDEIHVAEEPAPRYRRIALKDGRLVGASGIDIGLDGGILWQLILRRIDLAPVKEAFLARPQETARMLMSRIWR